MAIVASFILVSIPVLNILVWLVAMAVHEIGHALIHWFRGVFAIPTFGVTVVYSSQRSVFLFILFALILGAIYWYAYRGRYLILKSVVILFSCCLLLFSWVFSKNFGEMLAIYGGLGGELYLSALFFILFFEKWGTTSRAIQARYALLCVGALVYVNAFLKWFRIWAGTEELPKGALFDFGKVFGGESSGDIDRLIRDFGWSEQGLVTAYSLTAIASGVLMMSVYWLFISLYLAGGRARKSHSNLL